MSHKPAPEIQPLSTKDVLKEQDAGYRARWAGQRSTACPHRGPDLDRRRQEAWLRGYAAAGTDLRKQRAAGTRT